MASCACAAPEIASAMSPADSARTRARVLLFRICDIVFPPIAPACGACLLLDRAEHGAGFCEYFIDAEAPRDDLLLVGELDDEFERRRDRLVADRTHVDGAGRDRGLAL